MPPSLMASKVYTKEELCLFEKIPDPCAVVIFGASGDLAHRKLFPSLFYLETQSLLPRNYYVLGVARTKMTDLEFRDRVKSSLPSNAPEKAAMKFLERCHYFSGHYTSPDLYSSLGQILANLDKKFKVSNRRVFYLSVPPMIYADVIGHLGTSGLTKVAPDQPGWSRVVIEKPFGESLKTARQLNEKTKQSLRERQIYRIDHYLGKETVQNILMFRFANILFEPVWNRNYIDHVQITAAEEIGIEHRAGYYDHAGVIRDMFQNHLLQLVALIAMEPPPNLEDDAVRDKRVDVLKSIEPMEAAEIKKNTLCGQYGPGTFKGEKVSGYREEEGVNPQSRTPTFCALKCEINNWRWQGVPFYVRSGKRLPEKLVEISVHFKQIPTSIFKPLGPNQLTPNILKFRIQPDEGIKMNFEAKHPGPKLCMSTVTMDFSYRDTFGTPPPESYARLFLDAMLGDQTLFARSDGVTESWKIVDPIIEYWESKQAPSIPIYPAGTWGPQEGHTLLAQTGRSWDRC